jgi:hypothetical protein
MLSQKHGPKVFKEFKVVEEESALSFFKVPCKFKNIFHLSQVLKHLLSISSTFLKQLLRAQILKAKKIQSSCQSFGICGHKSCSYNVDEIDP